MATKSEASRSRRIALAVAIVAWTAIAWGGRIGLLAEGDSVWAWARIGGSVLIGLLVAFALLLPSGNPWSRPLIAIFLVWTVALWARSLVVNWLGDGSLPFKLVHTALATGFFALVWLVWRASRTQRAS